MMFTVILSPMFGVGRLFAKEVEDVKFAYCALQKTLSNRVEEVG